MHKTYSIDDDDDNKQSSHHKESAESAKFSCTTIGEVNFISFVNFSSNKYVRKSDTF